jgi:type II secretory pathway component PulC
LKPYINSSDLESFDQMMNMMNMMSMMQEMQINPEKEGETNDGLDE